MKKPGLIIKWILPLILLGAIGIGAGFWLSREETGDDGLKLQAARIKGVSDMLELCTLDIHEEMMIKDSIHGKWIVARQTIEGRVRFDLDSLRIEERGDTMVVYLPKERVDILENAGEGSYKVFDSWDGRRIIFPRTVSAAEENAIKRRWVNKARKRIYDRGYVRQAREDAAKTLESLYGALGEEVVVII